MKRKEFFHSIQCNSLRRNWLFYLTNSLMNFYFKHSVKQETRFILESKLFDVDYKIISIECFPDKSLTFFFSHLLFQKKRLNFLITVQDKGIGFKFRNCWWFLMDLATSKWLKYNMIHTRFDQKQTIISKLVVLIAKPVSTVCNNLQANPTSSAYLASELMRRIVV